MKGCNIFFGSKSGKHSELCGRPHYHATRKNLKSRTLLDQPDECPSGGNPLLIHKILHLQFSLLVWIVCVLCFTSKKNYQHGLDVGPFEFQFLWVWGFLTNLFRTLLLCFGVIGKTPCLISRTNFVKKIFVCIGHPDNVLARCDSILPLLRCQGVWNKTCTQISLSQIVFQNPKNYSLGDSRFCYHSWPDSMVIFEQITNSSNVYLSLSWFWMATSFIIFYQLLSILKSRIPPKNAWSVHSLIPICLLHQY